MLLAHLVRLAFGVPALLILTYALTKSRDRLHPFVGVLAFVTAVAPLATGYIWMRNWIEGLLYGLLTYAAACGFAMRLTHEHLPFRYHWPLLILFMISAVTAFVTIPLVVVPAIQDITVAVETDDGDADLKIQASLQDIDGALAKMQAEELNLQRGVHDVLELMKARSGRIQELQGELHQLEHLKSLTDEQIAALGNRLHSTPKDNIISFVVGIASSITAALALKFFVQSN